MHGVDGGLEGGALGGLHTDVQQCHLGIRAAQHLLGIIAAHIGKLEQILRGTLGIGSAVHQNRTAVSGGDHRGQSGAADTLDALGHQGGAGQQSAGGTGTDESIALPILHHGQTHSHGGVLLLTPGLGGVVTHLDDLAGVADGHVLGQSQRILLQSLLDLLLTAHQYDLNTILLGSLNGTLYRGQGGVVTAHCVYDDSHTSRSLFLVQTVQQFQSALG